MKKLLLLSIVAMMIFSSCDYEQMDISEYFDLSEFKSATRASRDHYSISTSDKLSSECAKAVMEVGGNAADAFIASSFVLCVTEGYASNLGGSGAAVIYNPKKDEVKAFDYRAEASSSYTDAAIPGLVSGLLKIYEDYATMD